MNGKGWLALFALAGLSYILGSKLLEAVSANRDFAQKNNELKHQNENTIQQVNSLKNQKEAVVKENAELKDKISKLDLPPQTA